MKKEFLLLVLTVCLIFCLNLSSCDDDFKTESVPGLWEKLRSTAWTMRKGDITYTIGFYGPQNGPEPKYEGVSNGDGTITVRIDESSYTRIRWNENEYGPYNEVYDEYKYPYCVIRIASDSGIYSFESLTRLQISRTGTISESRSDALYEVRAKDNGWTSEEKKFWRSNDFMRSFHVSISGNELTISNVKMGDVDSYDDDDNPEYRLKSYITKINGSYSYDRTDPKFNFDEGYQQLWFQIKNTAWTKQGSSTPSIGFYESHKGPGSSNYDNYMYFKVSVGTTFYINANKGGGYINAYNFDHDPTLSSYYGNNLSFRITVSYDTLTISDTRLGYVWDENNNKHIKGKFYFNGVDYTEEQAGAFFNGTYTMTSNSPTYSW